MARTARIEIRIAVDKGSDVTRPSDPRGGPPASGTSGIASPPVSRFARLKARAATNTTARKSSRGTAHRPLPRRDGNTIERRPWPLITLSRSVKSCESVCRKLLEEPLAPSAAVAVQEAGDQRGDAREEERE